MGHKVNPHGARVGVIFGWSGRWYAGKKDFANYLVEDNKLRKMLKEKYFAAGVSKIDIERTAQTVTINIFTSKPVMIIGPKGATIEQLKKDVTAFLGRAAQINVLEIKQPDADAQLVAGEAHQPPSRAEAGPGPRHEAARREGHQDQRFRPSGRR